MGRKKTRKKTSTTARRKNKKDSIGLDFIGGILVAIGVILLVILGFENTSGFALAFSEVLGGLFGILKIAIPIVFIIVGTECIVLDKAIYPMSEIIKGAVFVCVLSGLIYSFAYDDIFKAHAATKYIKWAWVGGVTGDNIGGIIGGLATSAIAGLLGMVATRVVFVILAFFIGLYFFNIGIRQFVFGIANIFMAIIEWFINMFSEVFEKDEDEIKQKETRRRNRELEKIREKERKLEFKKNDRVLENEEKLIKEGSADQLVFDLGKLDKEEKAKEQRDEFFKKQKEVKEDTSVKEVLQLDHTRHAQDESYIFPPISLLQKPQGSDKGTDKKAIQATAVKLQKTLASFGVDAKVTNITKGPTVTRYELTPSVGVKVSKIVNLSDDIALNLAAKSIRIEAPIPGKAAVGIEIPNANNEGVFLREVIESDKFKNAESKLTFAIGKDTAGDITVGDIAKMPHALIAGATGSGKSVCINSIITSILYKSKPSEVKLILVDPKMVELSGYNGIPHLLIPVVTDPKKAAGALNWAVQEMVNRYSLFASKGVKDIKGYNKIMETEEAGIKLPQIVIIIDELADLMMVAPNDVEDAICRLAQMARAAGMHLIIATQRPSVDVITGLIKANVPSRVAFTVSSQVDSRTVLDQAGAEKLLGRGDMLYFPVGEIKPLRMQGAFVTEKEVENIVEYIKKNTTTTYDEDIIESIEKANKKGREEEGEDAKEADVLLNDAIDLVVDLGKASASTIQRRFSVGYARAGRIIDQMELRGIISGPDGSKPRQVLISKEEWQELKMGNNNEENTEEEN